MNGGVSAQLSGREEGPSRNVRPTFSLNWQLSASDGCPCFSKQSKRKFEKRERPAYTWQALTHHWKQGHPCIWASSLCSLPLFWAKWSPHFPPLEPPMPSPGSSFGSSYRPDRHLKQPTPADLCITGCLERKHVLRPQQDSLQLPSFLVKLDRKRSQEFRVLKYRSHLSLVVQQSWTLRLRQEDSKHFPGYRTTLRPAGVW